MIASLRGTLLEIGDGACVVEAAGVGYWVVVSAPTARALPAVGQSVFLLTHQHVREDTLQLYGFREADERRLFLLLIGVSGVGPKVAMAVLSGLEPRALVKAIRDENVAALTTIPGIGRKTAERIVVDLRDKLEVHVQAGQGHGVLPRAERFEDAVAGLVSLGYSRHESMEAVRKVAQDGERMEVEELLRAALGRLSRPPVGATGR